MEKDPQDLTKYALAPCTISATNLIRTKISLAEKLHTKRGMVGLPNMNGKRHAIKGDHSTAKHA
eukprot:scaffold3526_cov153-Amphora_coffeaeformis.AAC.13